MSIYYTEEHNKAVETLRKVIHLGRPNAESPHPTPELREKYFTIKSMKQWKNRSKKFLDSVERWGFISYDLENRFKAKKKHQQAAPTTPSQRDPLECVLVGSMDGYCLDLHIPSLRRERKARGGAKDDLSPILPGELVQILKSEKILKLGSKIGTDAAKDQKNFGLEIRGCIDVRHLHKMVERFFSPSYEHLRHLPTRDHGKGRICFDIYGFDFKPMKAKTYFKRYNRDRPQAWKRHQCHSLDYWRRPLAGFAVQHRILDSLTPLMFLAYVGKQLLCQDLVPREKVQLPIKDLLKEVALPALVQPIKNKGYFGKENHVEYFHHMEDPEKCANEPVVSTHITNISVYEKAGELIVQGKPKHEKLPWPSTQFEASEIHPSPEELPWPCPQPDVKFKMGDELSWPCIQPEVQPRSEERSGRQETSPKEEPVVPKKGKKKSKTKFSRVLVYYG